MSFIADVERAKRESPLSRFRADCVWPKADFVEPTAEESKKRLMPIIMFRPPHYHRGITLIEILIVIAVLLILATVILGAFSGFRAQKTLDATTETVIAGFSRARLNTMSSKNDGRYGIHIEPTRLTYFLAPTFATGTATNVIFPLPKAVEFGGIWIKGGGNDIFFDRYTGATSQYGCLELRAKGKSFAKTLISIRPSGSVTTITDGLLHYFPLDNVFVDWQSNRAIDDGACANHGEMRNMSTSTSPVPGKISEALQFDGVNDYIDAGANGSFDTGSGDFTVAAWFKSTADTGVAQTILIKGEGGSGGKRYAMYLDNVFSCAANKAMIEIDDNVAKKIACSSATHIDNTWHHIVGVRDGNTLKLYMDGVLDATTNITGYGNINSARGFKIGVGWVNDYASLDHYFKGYIDDVRVYKRALTADEVRDLYGDGLIAHWKFDEGSGTTAFDSSEDNNGSLVNGPAWSSGRLGQAIDFDGSDDYVTYGDVLDVGTSNFTIAAWVKTDVVNSAYHAIATKNANFCPNYQFGLHSSNKFFMAYENPGCATDSTSFSANTATAGVWYHLVGVVDRTNGTTLYVDGVAQTPDPAETGSLDNTGTLYIGRHDGGLYWDGVIDDVRIYKRALTADEVWKLYLGQP